MSTRPLLIIVGVLLLALAILTMLPTLLKGRGEKSLPQPTPTASQVSPRAETRLIAITSSKEVAVGQEIDFDVNIETAGNLVTGVQLELSFDPTVIAIQAVLPGDFFANPIELANKVDPKGEIVFAVGSFEPKKGRGAVAKLKARALKKTAGTVEVLKIALTSLISEFDNTRSVLKEAKGAYLVIK